MDLGGGEGGYPEEMVTPDDADWPRNADQAPSLKHVDSLVAQCRACPRLVEWRERVGREKRRAFADWTYWARPVPSFGDESAAVAVVGLAPAAHGGNRTSRLFTGDQSGDVLYAALHRTGYANQPFAVSADDGMTLTGVRLTVPVHCAPPDNKPTPEEKQRCTPYLRRELQLLAGTLRVVVLLGAYAWQATLAVLAADGWTIPVPRPRFAHGAEVKIDHPDGRGLVLLGCFHPSQRNTFTGRLTPQMVDDVLLRARELARRDA